MSLGPSLGFQYTGNLLAAPVDIDPTKIFLPKHEPTKCSTKRNGIVSAYAANTNQGIIRNYNEDRVAIILNIMKPQNKDCDYWPKCSFFGVYDGHGGASCADYLRDNLHHFVVKDECFPQNPRQALMNGFIKAEATFIERTEKKAHTNPALLDKSGSCAVAILLVEDMCYVANVGDSRALMSSNQGHKVLHLTQDHRPSQESEQKRIIQYGGKIYQTQTMAKIPSTINGIQITKNQLLVGPYRVLPGRLSVSRTFGDIEAKLEKYGGKNNVISAEPEIISLRIKKDHDFLVLACDGIFDKLTSGEVVKTVWATLSHSALRHQSLHHQCGVSVEMILKMSVARKTLDNITVVMVAFNNFKKAHSQQKPDSQTSSGFYSSEFNIQSVASPFDIYMPDEGENPPQSAADAIQNISPGGDAEDEEEEGNTSPRPIESRQTSSFSKALPKHVGPLLQNKNIIQEEGSQPRVLPSMSGQNHFQMKQRNGQGSTHNSQRSTTSAYQKFIQDSSKKRDLKSRSSTLRNYSANIPENLQDHEQTPLPRHISPNVLSHPPSMRSPVHARHLATIENPYLEGSKQGSALPFSNYSISLKRDILTSSGHKKKTIDLLSRGSLKPSGKQELISNAYSPVAKRNSSMRKEGVSHSSKDAEEG